MKKLLFVLISMFIFTLAACIQKEDSSPKEESTKKEETIPTKEEEHQLVSSEDDLLYDFFMKDGTEAEFEGKGNEFAGFTAKTQWLYDRYVNVYEDNGGTIMLTTFRIDEDKIVVIQEEAESYDAVHPPESELEQMESLYTYLQFPLDKGVSFDGWEVMDNKANLKTPLQSFQNVIIIEKENEDKSITRKYFAKGYGEIKREYIMKENDDEFVVTSTIKKIK